jgi:hypothetical protein
MKHLLPCVLVAMLLGAGPAGAAGPTPPAADDAAAAVLACHAQYAGKYAKSTQASADEIAEGAFAGCKQEMDAYEVQALERAKAEAAVAVGIADARDYQRSDIARFREDVRSYTIDAVLKARALF